jgi:hypothetical protein
VTPEPPVENPFEYLIAERQQRLRQAALEQKENQQEGSRLKGIHKEKVLEKRGFDPLVSEVLKHLQQAAYPKLSLYSSELGWQIVFWFQRKDGSIGWNHAVGVQLVYDELTGSAVCFECSRHQRKLRAELNKESLADALQKLFPARKGTRPTAQDLDQKRYDALVAQAFAGLQKKLDLELHLLSDEEKWLIGIWRIQDGRLAWWGMLEIRMKRDWKGKVKGFECSGKDESALADLETDKLAETLWRMSGYEEEGST